MSIEIADIAGFELECRGCESRVFIPLKQYNEPHPACPHCQAKWLGAIGGPEYNAVHSVLENLRLLTDRAQQSRQSSAKLRFQLKETAGS